jgi:hypothetical protein
VQYHGEALRFGFGAVEVSFMWYLGKTRPRAFTPNVPERVHLNEQIKTVIISFLKSLLLRVYHFPVLKRILNPLLLAPKLCRVASQIRGRSFEAVSRSRRVITNSTRAQIFHRSCYQSRTRSIEKQIGAHSFRMCRGEGDLYVTGYKAAVSSKVLCEAWSAAANQSGRLVHFC